MTLEQFKAGLNAPDAPKFFTAYGHGGNPVVINRDSVVSIREDSGRLIIHYGFGDESAPAFIGTRG